jgi:signal transduction histidine kinase
VLPFVRDAMKEFAIPAIAKNISLDLFHGERIDEEAAFDIDPVKMSIVLRNFLSNALKFTPRGGHVTMVVDVVDYDKEKNLEGRSVIITVTDSGVGISPENARHLFEEGD